MVEKQPETSNKLKYELQFTKRKKRNHLWSLR